MSEEYWIGYLAGMIDGEGTIGLYEHYDRRGNLLFYVKVSIGSRNFSALKFLQEKFGGKLRSRHTDKPMYDLNWESVPKIKKLLSSLKLIIKQKQANLLLKACNHISYRRRYRPSWQERKLREIVKELKVLKHEWL